nr:unnamed protein product [Digitaria exilis]
MDQNSACKIAFDVSSFSTNEEGRVVYRKGRKLEWWVDSEEYSIIDMEKDVSEHFSWAKKVSQMEDESQVIDQNHELQLQIRIEGVSAANATVLSEFEGHEWAEEPELGVSAAGPARQEEEEKEHYLEPGFDPEGDDPIGADEEWRYFKKQENVQGGSNEKVQQEKKAAKKRKAYEAIDPDAVVSISKDHTCASTSQVKGKEASKGWIADKAKESTTTKDGSLCFHSYKSRTNNKKDGSFYFYSKSRTNNKKYGSFYSKSRANN